MLKTVIWLATILKFKMAAFTKLANDINTALNGFREPENMGIETKMKSLCASDTELEAKHDWNGGHFKIQDGCHYQVIQYYKKCF
jgi:hypothetical protein